MRSTQAQLTQRNTPRQRVVNACIRCRRQKIKCSGTEPCASCHRKKLACKFDNFHDKVLVDRKLLERLRNEGSSANEFATRHDTDAVDGTSTFAPHAEQREPSPFVETMQSEQGEALDEAARLGIELLPEARRDSEQTSEGGHAAGVSEDTLTNCLVDAPLSYVRNETGEQLYLGTSSNWSFSRRVTAMLHNRLSHSAVPIRPLVFKGDAYELHCIDYWDDVEVDAASTPLPTPDFAEFLINVVRFRCGQMFHLFDERDFMERLHQYHRNGSPPIVRFDTWSVHYTLLLALGKALNGEYRRDRQPPGADLFAQGMRYVPHLSISRADPIGSIEALCCAAIYLLCVDKRQAAHSLIGQALRTAVFEGFHTDMRARGLAEPRRERCRSAWWTVYLLDCHMSSILGVPHALLPQDISTQLPNPGTSPQDVRVLEMHIKLADITSAILRSIYSKEGQVAGKFLENVRGALRSLASANDVRVAQFPVPSENASSSISRCSAYLQLFYNQCIILATRPLLFCFWQHKLSTSNILHASSSGGLRALLRICVGASFQVLKLLSTLQSQCLLESFITFDLEVAWSSAIVIAIARSIDSSLLPRDDCSRESIDTIFSEMVSKRNLAAAAYKEELGVLEEYLHTLKTSKSGSTNDAAAMGNAMEERSVDASSSSATAETIQNFDYELGVSGEQLIQVADDIDSDCLEWLMAGGLDDMNTALINDLPTPSYFHDSSMIL